MKKSLYFAATALLAASCASDEIVEETNNGYQPDTKAPISFITNQKNITRAIPLQDASHYNFGVFAYKSTEATNNIMDNYLVGYMGNNVGYYMTSTNQTTLGDTPGTQNGESQWAYEKMGKDEYDYTGGEGYYTKDQIAYMSNVDKQYLRYWDKSAPNTTFYAYSPYVNSATTPVTYDNSTKVMTIPDGSIVAGYDNPTDNEFMYAVNQVSSSDYGKDVALVFKRLNAKVNIKFWEDIDGYSVRILNLSDTYNEGVYAKPAKVKTASTGDYDVTDLYVKGGASINFSTIATPTASITTSDADKSNECLKFSAPTDAEIGTTRLLASPSATTYYAVPQPTGSNTGLTFHVSYELTSNTGEKIIVKDATVHVPAANVTWASNYHYTYIFKITASANGSTEANPSIDPNDPDVPTDPALYPIIFDNCTVEDYEVAESDHVITEGTNEVNYSVVLDNTTIDAKLATPGSVTPTLKEDGTDVASPAGTWSITPASATGVTFNATTGVATIATNATAGKYVITYTPTAAEQAPASSYSAEFVVIGKNAITLSTAEIGTGGTTATELTITSTAVNGTTSTPTTGQLEIVYPTSLTAEQKSKVNFSSVNPLTTIVVAKDAIEGTYTVKYTTDEGTAQATFEVKNYGLTLTSYTINHNNTDQTITASTTATDGVISLATGTPTTITLSGSTITVGKTTAEGTYTVINTVTKGTSVTTYEKTFTVKNVYVLSVNKPTIDNDGDAATRTITISATKNAVAETTLANVTMTDPNGDAVTLPTTGMTYEVPANAVLGTYTVKYNGEETTFIVQD